MALGVEAASAAASRTKDNVVIRIARIDIHSKNRTITTLCRSGTRNAPPANYLTLWALQQEPYRQLREPVDARDPLEHGLSVELQLAHMPGQELEALLQLRAG